MEPLTIRLLGSPEVTVCRRPLTFPTRKVLALLVYLAVEGGRPSRETLMALLWPEIAPEKAAITLRGALSRLRQSLRPAGEYILTEGATVTFDFDETHDMDLTWLAAAARREVPSEGLDSILSLDRGDFLEGFSLPDAPGFDTWAAIQRENCQRQLETVYDRLSQHQLATHDSVKAVETAARWVVRASLSEQAYRRLMASQALNGERAAALQTYEQLRAKLHQELGLEPGRETAVLADNIGQGCVAEDRRKPLPMVNAASTEIRGQRLTLPLVGRAEEHSQFATRPGR